MTPERKAEPLDPVQRAAHYNVHPSGVETIEVIEHFSGCLFNAVKYIWRRGEKGSERQDLEKAAWYFSREIERLSTGWAAVSWDSRAWVHPAILTAEYDSTILGDVLRILIATSRTEEMTALMSSMRESLHAARHRVMVELQRLPP